jgi:hypothetical protein
MLKIGVKSPFLLDQIRHAEAAALSRFFWVTRASLISITYLGLPDSSFRLYAVKPVLAGAADWPQRQVLNKMVKLCQAWNHRNGCQLGPIASHVTLRHFLFPNRQSIGGLRAALYVWRLQISLLQTRWLGCASSRGSRYLTPHRKALDIPLHFSLLF